MTNNDDNLFHFTSAETVIDFILKENTLKFSSFNYVNDPKESKSWPFKFYGDYIENKKKLSPLLFEKCNETIKDHWLVLCMTKADKDIVYDMKMWDSYGQRHKGVCLVFDHKKLSKVLNSQKDNFLFESEILYSKEMVNEINIYSIEGFFYIYLGLNFPFLINQVKNMYNPFLLTNISDPFMISLERFLYIGRENYMKWHSVHFYKTLFFNKSLFWKQEKEYRYILYSDKVVDKKFMNFKDSLKEVVLGNDINSSNRIKIKEMLKGTNIKISQLVYNNWHESIFDITNSEENDTDVFDISTSYRVDIPQRFLYAPINTKNGPEFLFFDWSNGEMSLMPSKEKEMF